MSDQPIDRTDISSAFNSVSFPSTYETQGDADKVQWAARRAVAALQRLSLECSIADARRRAANDGRAASRARKLAAELAKLRGRNR